MCFRDRIDAGIKLSDRLRNYADKKTVLYGVARGGVVLARVISGYLSIPFYIINVKKIGVPGNPELSIGAISDDDSIYIDYEMVERLGLGDKEVEELIKIKRGELKERNKLFSGKKFKSFSGKTVIIVDDGIATGATVCAALKFFQKKRADKIILAVPVVSKNTFEELKTQFDKIVALEIPESFGSVGQFYRDFGEVSDSDIIKVLNNTKNLEPKT